MELTLDQALQQGVAAHKDGKLQEAERLYLAILHAQPSHPDANHNLGVLAVSTGKPHEAIPLFKLALEANPKVEQFWLSYLDALIKLERFDEAKHVLVEGEKSGVSPEKLEILHQQIQTSPPEDKKNTKKGLALSEKRKRLAEKKKSKKIKVQGSSSNVAPSQDQINGLIEHYQTGRLAEAEQLAVSLSQQFSSHPFAWKVLGATLQQTGRLKESLLPMQKSVELSPQDAEAHNNLGITLKKLGRLEESEASCRQAIALQPDYTEARNNLGVTLKELGRFEEAEASYRQAITLDCGYAEAHSNLGNLLKELGRLDEAEASCRQAIALKPGHAEAHTNLGITLKELGRLDEAEASHRQAIALRPDYAETHYNLGNTLQELGRLDEAEASYKQAIALKPDHAKARDNLLFVLNYDHRLSAADLYAEYAAYGEAVAKLTKRRFDHNNHAPVSGRRVRIGYSSPDFRGHACRFFMEPIFRHHNRDEFELFAYSNTRPPDNHTDRLKGYFDHWIDVTLLSDEAMAERIYSDRIDILVDMAGHTQGNRLLAFAMRPAPIQVGSPIGYGYTTGLKEVDYFIGDENLTPLGSEPYFAEHVWRIPAPCLAYEPPREVTPDVSELPALRKGYVTFGSLTRIVRLNDSVFAVWKEILDRVPNSRLRLDQKPFIAESTREIFWTRLEEVGIPRARVELVCTTPHWNAYHDIDITLDCWPHNAGTTTIESLWMGVPVLSKVDRPSMGCVGASILKPAGLGDWVVSSETEYVERALQASSDLSELAKLRAGLRQRLEGSAMLDGASLTHRVEVAYKKMLDQSEKVG